MKGVCFLHPQKPRKRAPSKGWVLAFLPATIVLSPQRLPAHCDTMDGPVVTDARRALERRELAPVLKWIREDQEDELRTVFARVLAVRGLGKEARELADRYFFETAVRLHRAAEGQPYTGLKPAGAESHPAVEAAEQALEHGDVQPLIHELQQRLAGAVQQRFDKACQTRARADRSVAEGRAHVAAYVDYVHFVRLLHDLTNPDAPHGSAVGSVLLDGHTPGATSASAAQSNRLSGARTP